MVTGTVTIGNRITISGDVNLILCDRAELEANSGVTVDVNNNITNSLTIWAQSTNAVAGKLTARGGVCQAGIGGGDDGSGGTVTVNGGKVTANGGSWGAGIGGGWDGAGGTVTVNGGKVTANGGSFGAGIGGGECGAGGTVVINGGAVEAHGGDTGAGIGGGWDGAGGTVTVNGGKVTAQGGEYGAGIGGGWDGAGGEVTVNGGTVEAHGGNYGAGIGGGDGGGDGSLSIAGMKVGYVESDGEVHEWAAPGDRDGYCRNRNGKTVRIEVCDPHEYVGVNCRWCGASVAVEFGKTEYEVGEGAALTVEVKGGNAKMPSRAAVCLSYLTAAAADLDLKNGTVDGVTPKGGLKFPLTLTWDAGDKAPKTITIPVKEDKTVEGYETFVLQLAEPVGMELGEKEIAQVTIADKNDKQLKPSVSPYKPKKGETVATNTIEVSASPSDLGFAAGSGSYTAGTKLTMVAEARPGCAFVGWERDGKVESDKPKYQIVVSNDVAYTAKFAAVDYMCGLAYPADGGKVTGSGYCPAGKKVTLKAAANKNFTFLGWRQGPGNGEQGTGNGEEGTGNGEEGTGNGEQGTGNAYVATTASLVIDRTAKPAKDSKTSTTISNLTESTTFYAVFTGDPLVSAIPVLVDGDVGLVSNEVGKVTGAGRYAPGKKVTLKATANKGFAFSGFFDAEGNLLDETRSASLSFEIGDEDVPLTARFVTVDADKESITLKLAMSAEAEAFDLSTNEIVSITNFCGVAMNWPVVSGGLSETKVKVAGLPSGLKFTDKPVTSKIGSGKTAVTVTNVPANTIYGAPTAASKTDKDGNPVPSTVKVTVTTAGKSSATYEIALTVDPLPAWAVGNFEGFVNEGPTSDIYSDTEVGPATMSVTAAGKVSGKCTLMGTNWTFKADSYAIRSELSDTLTNFVVETVVTAGKVSRILSLDLQEFPSGVASAVSSVGGGFYESGSATPIAKCNMIRVPWSDKGDAKAMGTIAAYAGAYTYEANYGVTACPVMFTLDEKGVIKGSMEVPNGAKTRKVTFSSYALPYFDGLITFLAVSSDQKKGYLSIFDTNNIVNHHGESADYFAYRDPGVVATTQAYNNPEASGTVTVSPKYGQVAAGKDVSLAAKADKGSVFYKWEITGLDTTGLDLSAATLKFKSPGTNDVFATAVFVKDTEDADSIGLAVGGAGLKDAVPTWSNYCGVAVNWDVEATALSATTVKATGLPAGLKLVQDKKTKTYTVEGVPTAVSKAAKGSDLLAPSPVKFTVTTAGKSSKDFTVNLVVLPLPAWAVGTFDGAVSEGNGEWGTGNGEEGTGNGEQGTGNGTVSITVAANGKISGKILEGGKTWALAAASFSAVEGQLSDVDNLAFRATVIGTAGKEVATNEVTVTAGTRDASPYQSGVVSGWTASEPSISWTAYQNLWKRADTKAEQPVIKKDIKVDHELVEGDANNKLTLTFKKDGAVSFAGKVGGASVSGSSQLVNDGEGWKVTLYAPQKGTFAGFCKTFAVTLTLDAQDVVTAVYVVVVHGKVQLWEGGPYWATTNIGAEKPEDYGYYFWWGDTVGYKWENEQWVASDGSSRGFSFSEMNASTMGKDLATLQSEGWITEEGVLAPEHDAAHVKWGGGWRMPTEQELSDLTNRCDWTWMTLDDVNGYEVRGRGGYTSASIFLPASGAGDWTSLNNVGSYGAYFSSVPELEYYNVWYIGFNSIDYYMVNYGNRRIGFTIRPVQSPAE